MSKGPGNQGLPGAEVALRGIKLKSPDGLMGVTLFMESLDGGK